MDRRARTLLQEAILRDHRELLKRTLLGELADAGHREAWLRQHPVYGGFMRWYERERPPDQGDGGENLHFEALVARYVEAHTGRGVPPPGEDDGLALLARRVTPAPAAPVVSRPTDYRAAPRRQAGPPGREANPHTLIGWVAAALVVFLLLGAAAARGGTLGDGYVDPGDDVPALADPWQQQQDEQRRQEAERCLQDWLGAQEEFTNALAELGGAAIVAPPPRPAC